MIATRFRSVYWVGGVAVAALGCYLVSQRVAAERASLATVESEIVVGERQIRALETEIGTRAGMNQIERWNTEVLSLSAPRASQFVASEVQLASLFVPVKPAMEAPALTQVAAAAPPTSTPQVTRASFQAPVAQNAPTRDDPPAAVRRTSYAPARRTEAVPERVADKSDAARNARARKSEPERTATAERPAKIERTANAERPAKIERTANAERPAKIERTAKIERAGKAERAAKSGSPELESASRADRKAQDNTPRVRPAIYVKPAGNRQSMALLDDKLLGDLGRLARNERADGKRNR